jgi:hypothetical protein
MGYKMKGSSFYGKKGESPAKQTYTTPEMLKEKNDAEIDLNTSKASGKVKKEQQDRYDKAAAGFIQKNTEDNDRRKAEGTPYKQIDKEQKTYEDTWKSSDAYKNLTKANAPKEAVENAKTKWSTGKNKK